MSAKANVLGHEIYYDGQSWRLSETDEKLYTPELASGGQTLRCAKCLKLPSPEGHDGCLGTLVSDLNGGIMNACCGHGNDSQAYIQYWDRSCIRGEDAVKEQKSLLSVS